MSMKPKQYYTKKCWLLNIQAFEVKKRKKWKIIIATVLMVMVQVQKYINIFCHHFMIFSKLFLSSIWFDICYPIFPENIPKVSILCSTFFSSYKAFLAGKRNTKIYVDDLMITDFLNIHISYWKGHACIWIIYLKFVI